MQSIVVFGLALLGGVLAVPMPQNCGRPAVQPILSRDENERVIGGREARPYSWPWQIQIRLNNGHHCGASILSNDWLLSAAHCFYGFNANSLSFRAASHNRDYNDPYVQVAYARNIYMHEQYNSKNFNNDIALVQLSKPLTFNSYVSPVCLATQEPAHNTQAWVTGWGLTKGTCCDGKLNQAMLPIVSRQTCNSAGWWGGMISSAMICAGPASSRPTACSGDSGGPLVVPGTNGAFQQVGAVSWGTKSCSEPNKPGVFVSVAYFNKWITSRVKTVEREQAEAKLRKFHPRMGAAFRALVESIEETNSDDASSPNSE